MRAVQFSEYGEPSVLHVEDVPEPHAGPGQIRIAVRAAGVNPIDWKVRSGALASGPLEQPIVPGSDVAGVVDEVGEGVEDVSAGDAVFGFAIGGAAAERALLAHYAVKPDAMPWEEAGGLPVAVETAGRTLALLGLRSGQSLLVNGAAGGVGLAVVQFALARGARVIGTAGVGNHEFLASLGVEPVEYGEGLLDRVREMAPSGVDRALDVAGHGPMPDMIELAGGPEHVVTIADFTAGQYGVRVTTGSGEERAWQALGEAAELFEAGRFRMPVARMFSFEEAAEAHRLSQDGHVRGKLVLVPA